MTISKASGEVQSERISTTQPEITLILSYSAYHLNISAINNASTSPPLSQVIPAREDTPGESFHFIGLCLFPEKVMFTCTRRIWRVHLQKKARNPSYTASIVIKLDFWNYQHYTFFFLGLRAGKVNITVHNQKSFTVHWKDNLIDYFVCYAVEWMKKGYKVMYKSFYEDEHNWTLFSLPGSQKFTNCWQKISKAPIFHLIITKSFECQNRTMTVYR